ncbi:MAG: class II glutamine amidotransferase, partial [Shewanella sp.]|uniref:class II glutamine amidotransferase n=1 Tax=Shewanella sp. TaxID=50422 RepID=UPI003C7464D8
SEYHDKFTVARFQPVGDTDSELAFCWILESVVNHFGEQEPENMQPVFEYIATLADEIRELGVFNMLLSNGIDLMAYCTNNLCHITRRAPFGKATLIDTDVVIDFSQETTPNDVVTVIATRPLTNNENWVVLSPGDWKLFRKGELVLG